VDRARRRRKVGDLAELGIEVGYVKQGNEMEGRETYLHDYVHTSVSSPPVFLARP
jgi:hypothetical protein